MAGKLYLIPVTLGSEGYVNVIPEGVINIVKELRKFIVEDIRSARRFLRNIDKAFPIDNTEFFVLNEHSSYQEIESILEDIGEQDSFGLMSEAGVPCVADPGSPLIQLAHNKSIRVIPLSGPSSILLALMASGMSGQAFKFNGYIPIKTKDRVLAIKKLEADANKGVPQIFIEAPYRNQKLLESILVTCQPDTLLCIATDITSDAEFIKTMKTNEWKKNKPEINKRPTVFILG